MAGATCPCGSGLDDAVCCAPLLADDRPAPTAEQLMRSRFTAFAVGDAAYLRRTWHASTRPAELSLDETIEWYRLDVVATSGGSSLDTRGTVEFRAFWRSAQGRGVQQETSRFVREHGRWWYVDGDVG